MLPCSREFFGFAEPCKDVNAQKSVLELGFDESRFIDKAGRMGLARSRGDLLETFTFMQEEADSEWIDLLDWNNLIDRNKSFSDIFVIDNHGETVKLMKGTVTDMFVVTKFTDERFDSLFCAPVIQPALIIMLTQLNGKYSTFCLLTGNPK